MKIENCTRDNLYLVEEGSTICIYENMPKGECITLKFLDAVEIKLIKVIK
jgi:hypothetical protein